VVGRRPSSLPYPAAGAAPGLLLVHELADSWGVRTHGVGKAVWFELDAQEP
ncbi:ATP-binding protein, partial [Streptomyces sp. NPDC049577]